MIGHIHGVVIRHAGSGVVVDVQGVGYIVSVTAGCAGRLNKGDEVSFLIHTHVSDSAMSLYGFEEEEQMWLFCQLIGVNGVGPKMAMSILNVGACADIMGAIAGGDVAFLTQVSGVGKRTAERVVVDLKEKVGGAAAVAHTPEGSKLTDVVDALVAMGYGQHEAREVIRHMEVGEKNVEQLIRESLNIFSRA